MLADLTPKVGQLETQYAAQQIELHALDTTHELEIALLSRSNAAMDEGTKALEAALQVGDSAPGSLTPSHESIAAVSRIFQRRAARLATSVLEMQEDVYRAKKRLERVRHHIASRKAANISLSKLDSVKLKSMLESARKTRVTAADESQKKLASLRLALEQARERAIEESSKDMLEMHQRLGKRRAHLLEQADTMSKNLSTAKRKVCLLFFQLAVLHPLNVVFQSDLCMCFLNIF